MPRFLGFVFKAWQFRVISLLGNASDTIPWPNGISKLDREFPSRSLRKGEETRAHNAMDQENRSSQLAEGPHQSQILSRIGFGDGGRIETVLRWVSALRKEDPRRRAESSKGQPISQRESDCLFHQRNYRAWSRDKRKGAKFLHRAETGECFQRKTIGSCSRGDTHSFLHTHATGDRETTWEEVEDVRRSRLEQASSSVPKV